MKIKYIIIILAFFFTSCEKWLNLSPDNLVTKEELFKVGSGYRNALNGLYRQMSSTKLWGREMSWGFVDVIGQCYKIGSAGIPSSYSYYNIALKYDYKTTSAKNMIAPIWEEGYNVIANCNSIIGEIKNVPASSFLGGEDEKELILGESLAIRGFMHFELMRLFAPAAIEDKGEPIMPYFKKFPSVFEEAIKMSDMFKNIIEDIKEGQRLITKFDTTEVDGYSRINQMSSSNRFKNADKDEIFFGYRGYRMNLCAVTGILARVYNYQGKHTEATTEAQKVIDMKSGYYNIFSFSSLSDVKGAKKMHKDLIFSLSDIKLYENYKQFNLEGSTSIKLVMKDKITDAFDDNDDYRKTQLLTTTDNTNFRPNRNIEPLNPNSDSKMVADMLPILRLSEMHYIVAEAHAAVGDWEKAKKSMDIVRDGRNCSKGRLLISDIDAFKKEMIKEVRREFLGEGQVFFYYKKFGIKPLSTMHNNAMTLPKPDSESIH